MKMFQPTCAEQKKTTGDGKTDDGNSGNKDSSASTMTVLFGLAAFLFTF